MGAPNKLEPEERRRYRAAQVRLFAHMTERGIMRVWLARRLGISKSLLHFYEHKSEMPLWRFDEACRALEVPPERFGWQALDYARRMARRAS